MCLIFRFVCYAARCAGEGASSPPPAHKDFLCVMALLADAEYGNGTKQERYACNNKHVNLTRLYAAGNVANQTKDDATDE